MDSLVRPEPACCSRHEPEYKGTGAFGVLVGVAIWLPIILFTALFVGAFVLNLLLIPFR